MWPVVPVGRPALFLYASPPLWLVESTQRSEFKRSSLLAAGIPKEISLQFVAYLSRNADSSVGACDFPFRLRIRALCQEKKR